MLSVMEMPAYVSEGPFSSRPSAKAIFRRAAGFVPSSVAILAADDHNSELTVLHLLAAGANQRVAGA